MVKFGIELENNQTAIDFLNATKERLSSSNIATNPFSGIITQEIIGNKLRAYFIMESIYPNPLIFIILSFIAVMLLTKFTINYWYIIPLLLSVSLVTRTKVFFYNVLVKGLIKVGYLNDSKLIPYKEI